MSILTLHTINKINKFAIVSSIAFLAMTNSYAANTEKKSSAPEWMIQQDIKHDVSRPLRDMALTSQSHLHSPSHKIVPFFHIPLLSQAKIQKPVSDVLESKPLFNNLNVTINTFQGIGIGLGSYQPRFAPPDANGAAGLTQYVQLVNADFAVFNKQTGQVIAGFPKPLNTLFSGFGGLCESTNNGDGVVKYDQLANRWIITQFAFSDIVNGPFVQCIAVSKTSDATGAYNRYAYQFDSFNDFGKLGLWPDAYYMTFNMFGPVSTGPRVCAFNRNAMLAGQAAAMQCKQLSFDDSGSLLPADLDGQSLPPTGNPEYLMTLLPPSSLGLYKFHVDFSNPANTTLSTPVVIPVGSYQFPCPKKNGDWCVKQPSTTTKLDVVSDRLMNRMAYRQFADHGAMMATHTILSSANQPAVRWYELDFSNGSTDAVITRKGTVLLDTAGFIGSIAIDKLDNIAMGFSTVSDTLYPSITLAARLSTDSKVTIIQDMINGTGSQTDGLTRWGDYNSMTLDPADDCTFWYTNEYLKSTGSFNWSTLIGNFKLAGC
jgi:hypothetical protein